LAQFVALHNAEPLLLAELLAALPDVEDALVLLELS
jgi:hypothetical protein